MRTSLCLVATATLALLCGCSSAEPDITRIYQRVAENEARNPVVVIHGILGAQLVDTKTDKIVWGAFTNEAYDPTEPEGAQAIALPLKVPKSAMDYDHSKERVQASGPLEAFKVGVIFDVVEVDIYRNILLTLGAGGYTDNVVLDPGDLRYTEDHFTCHTFFYDWRRDNVENAKALHEKLLEIRETIATSCPKYVSKLRAAGKHKQADNLQAWFDKGYKFDIVAHSMGGLIARYYLRYGAHDLPKDGSEPKVTWEGAQQIDRLILVGTPSLGSVLAMKRFTEGFQAVFFVPKYHPGILCTMPSIYQLVPRQRHDVVRDARDKPTNVDLLDVDLWVENRWGIFDDDDDTKEMRSWLMPNLADDAARKAQAKKYVAWCMQRAKQFHAALDRKPEIECPSRVYLYAGDAEPTPVRTKLVERDGRLFPTFPEGELYRAPGDTTVARYAAVGDERMGQKDPTAGLRTNIPYYHKIFLPEDHIGLTQSPVFSNNVLHTLLEDLPQ